MESTIGLLDVNFVAEDSLVGVNPSEVLDEMQVATEGEAIFCLR